jgi:hypothetical protein
MYAQADIDPKGSRNQRFQSLLRPFRLMSVSLLHYTKQEFRCEAKWKMSDNAEWGLFLFSRAEEAEQLSKDTTVFMLGTKFWKSSDLPAGRSDRASTNQREVACLGFWKATCTKIGRPVAWREPACIPVIAECSEDDLHVQVCAGPSLQIEGWVRWHQTKPLRLIATAKAGKAPRRVSTVCFQIVNTSRLGLRIEQLERGPQIQDSIQLRNSVSVSIQNHIRVSWIFHEIQYK